MFDSLEGKRALVTGSSTGIGAAIAELLAQSGARVGVHYRSSRREAEAVVDRVRQLSDWGGLFQADLTEQEAPHALIKNYVEAAGGIDILINNAGAIYNYVHFSELDGMSWDKTFQLNVKAPFCLIRDAFPHMQESGGGRIINISTVSAKFGGSAFNLHYGASKAALDALTVGFAREGARHNILVNSIRSGIIRTPMQEKIPGYVEDRFEKRVALVPLRSAGRPEDIARMAVYLASDGGSFITGQIIPVTGGE